MARGMRETVGTRFRRVLRQVSAIQQAKEADQSAFFRAYAETLTDEELDKIIADTEAGKPLDASQETALEAQFAQYQKEKKQRKENGEPEKPLEPPCPPVRLFLGRAGAVAGRRRAADAPADAKRLAVPQSRREKRLLRTPPAE